MSVDFENLILSAIANNDAYEALATALAETDIKNNESLKSTLLENANDIIDNVSTFSRGNIAALLALATAGAESTSLREKLENALRETFSDFPDPATLVSGFAALDENVKASTLAERWTVLSDVFSEFAKSELICPDAPEKTICYNSALGFGEILSIDALGDQITCKFRVTQRYTLANFLAKCNVVKPGTLTATLALKEKLKMSDFYSQDIADDLELNITPRIKSNQAIQTRLLMPTYFKTAKLFQTWFKKKAADNKKGGASTGVERYWGNSRSLPEFKEQLAKVENIDPNEEEKANLFKIFSFAASKPLQSIPFSECLTHLWVKCKDKHSLDKIIEETGHVSAVWSDSALFIEASENLPAKELVGWMMITELATNSDWLSDQALLLPLKHWVPIEKAITAVDGNFDIMVQKVAKKAKSGHINADALVWLWAKFKDDPAPIYPIACNAPLIFRTIAKGASGTYIKAQKDLKKLLLENEDFQKFLMNNGTPADIKSLVGATRNLAGLDNGDRQTLLVRMVRLFPEQKHLVENKKGEIKQQKLARFTSFRSFKIKQDELNDIVKVQLPDVTEAIQVAKEWGDLKENSEYKMAKERQKFLQSRRAELEKDLGLVVPTDFADVLVDDRAVPGSIITIDADGTKEVYTILGVWDSSPEDKHISFETPMGKALLGKVVGDKFETPNGKPATIKKVAKLTKKLIKELAQA